MTDTRDDNGKKPGNRAANDQVPERLMKSHAAAASPTDNAANPDEAPSQ